MSKGTTESVERWLRGAPTEIRDYFRTLLADVRAAKEPYVMALRANGRTDLTEAQLRAKPFSDLQAMAALAQVTPTGDTPEAPRFFTGAHRERVQARDPAAGPGFFSRQEPQGQK